jgi:hypothetical protein
MALLCVWIFRSTFGTVVVVKPMTTKDRLERKKYMGLCRWTSVIMARMMSGFPSTVTRYMDRNSLNIRGCWSEPSETPRRRNSEILESFIYHMCLKIPIKRRKTVTHYLQH